MHNILIVDDIGKNIQVLASLLPKSQYAISFAMDGSQALQMIGEEEYDLILLDVMMPGMDGFEVCQRIKEIPGKESIPIIFLTARTQQDDINRGFVMGAVDYITKPFNAHELRARIETHIHLKLARDTIEEKNRELQLKNKKLRQLNDELNRSLEQIKTLEGVIPICCICKNIRDDKGYWEQVEGYIAKHSLAQFSHSICPDCIQKHYSEYYEKE